MGYWGRPGYWENRDQKADRYRSHPEDAEHRRELLKQIAAIRRSVRVGRSVGLAKDAKDIRINTLLSWAQASHFNVYFDFDGFEVPASVGPQPMDDPKALLAWAKGVVREVRLAKGIGKTDMDRMLDQQYGVHNTWELRVDGFMVSAMQRAVRALGGTFRIRLEHKHNPGLLRRMAARKR